MSSSLDSDVRGAIGARKHFALGVPDKASSRPGERQDPIEIKPHPAWVRYAVGILAVALGWLAREALSGFVGKEQLPFIFFFPAIATACWYGGLGPGILALILGGFAAEWYYLSPHNFGLTNGYDTAALAGYMLAGAFIIAAVHLKHRVQQRLLVEIGERTKAQQAFREEKDLLAITLSSIGDAVIATDDKGRITFINLEAERLTEWKADEALGQPIESVFRAVEPVNHQPVDCHPVNLVLQQKGMVADHGMLIGKSGKAIPIDDSASPIRRTDGSVSGAIMVFRDITAKQLAERTSARLAAIVEFSGDAILTKNLDGIVQTWNAAAQRLFGYTAEEIIGRPVTVLFPKDRLNEEDTILARLRAGHAVERLETIRVAKDGRRIHISVSISPIKDSKGTIIGASKIIHDISERVAAQEALLEEKEQLSTTLASIGDAVILTNAQGNVTFLNGEAERLTQWTKPEAIGQSLARVFRIVHAESRLPVEDPVAKVIRLGSVVGLANSTILLGKHGAETPINDSAAPIRRSGGPLFGIVLVFRDFSEQEQVKREQQTLYSLVQAVNQARALPDIYQAALTAISECLKADRSSILFFDADGVMRFKAWAGLSDEYRKAVEGHSPWTADQKDPQPICISTTSEAEAAYRPIFEREGIQALAFIPITYEGRLLGKFMVYYNLPHAFTEEELRLALTVASQVALAVQRRRTEQELESLVRERTSKLREMMAELQHVSYAITHDMRAPLRAMSTFAGIILDEISAKPDSSPELLDSCRRIISSAGRLDQLIQDALNYTKAVLQELPLHPVNLAHLIPSLIESYPNLQADKADIRLVDPLPTVLGEESLLTQCFSNLLGNAVKFVAPGTRPQVSIHSTCADSVARITIQDNGIGIPKESQRRLFGMFERLTSGYEGTGIGLAIVRKVVERMGGKVGVVSSPGEGSRFWVELRTASSANPPGGQGATGANS